MDNDKEIKKGIDQADNGDWICQVCHHKISRRGQEYCDKCGQAIWWPESVLNPTKEEMTKKSWKEFRDTGLVWFINSILHLFGWAIVCVVDNTGGYTTITDVYPARVRYRGFSEESNENGYKKVTTYLKENINDLLEEVNDETD